ncbi:MAG: hypothetical protein K9K37_10055 [Desulfocapsa sp.]|nr:hypothetical protein [Desulfocapsa sp.]
MMKAIGYAIFLLLLFLLLGLFFSRITDTEAPPSLPSDFDAIKRQLELGRHEKLQAIKGNPENVLTEFTTDGCSGGLSVGWEYLAGTVSNFQKNHGEKPPWESCCVEHDLAYHTGGIRSANATTSFEARRKADLTLKACVIEIGKQRGPELMKEYNLSAAELEHLYNGIANLMYGAVRIGGMPCTDLPWRWGYGWPECR